MHSRACRTSCVESVSSRGRQNCGWSRVLAQHADASPYAAQEKNAMNVRLPSYLIALMTSASALTACTAAEPATDDVDTITEMAVFPPVPVAKANGKKIYAH